MKAGIYSLVVLIGVILQGCGSSVIGHLATPQLADLVIFIGFSCAAAYGMGVRVLRGVGSVRAPRKDVLLLNAYSAGTFILFYISTTMTLPTAVTIVETSMAAVILGIGVLIARRAIPTGSLLNLIAVAWVVFAVLADAGDKLPAALTGIIFAAAAGWSALGILAVSKRLASIGCDTPYILSIRFHGAWIASGVLLLIGEPGQHSTNELLGVGLLSIPCITIPVIAMQYGIGKAPITTSAALVALVPAVVFLTDLAVFRTADSAVIGPLACVMAAACLATIATRRSRLREPALEGELSTPADLVATR